MSDIAGMEVLYSDILWAILGIYSIFYLITNPINNSYDVFETSREKVQNAIIEYERVYDENIELIMEINTMMNQIQLCTSNGDKLKSMEQVLDRFNAAIAAMNMYYGEKPGSEDLN